MKAVAVFLVVAMVISVSEALLDEALWKDIALGRLVEPAVRTNSINVEHKANVSLPSIHRPKY